MASLTSLDIRFSSVTAQGVASLQKTLPNCEITWDGNTNPNLTAAEWVLEIGGSIETDKGEFTSFDDLPLESFQVIKVDVSGSPQVTNDDLEQFKGLANLTTLDLSNTKVTPEAVADLKKALPKCEITGP